MIESDAASLFCYQSLYIKAYTSELLRLAGQPTEYFTVPLKTCPKMSTVRSYWFC